jgi:hypothetical protein
LAPINNHFLPTQLSPAFAVRRILYP